MYRLAIFDMDGTLLDTLADLAESCNYALAKYGFPTHEYKAYKEFIGHGPVYLVTYALPESNRDSATVKKVRDVFAPYYEAHAIDLTKPYDGAVDMLKQLKKNGVKIAIFTNKPHDNAVRMSESYFSGLIDMVVGYRDGINPKPDPSAGFEIMRAMGTAPEETVYVGDSGVDMQTGKKLGAYTVGVSWGFRPKTELNQCGADVIVDKVSQLSEILIDK